MTRALTLVAAKPQLPAQPSPAPALPAVIAEEPLGARVRRMQAEARRLALEHAAVLGAALGEVERIAGEVACGGEAYPAGVRDLAERLAVEAGGRRLTLQGLLARR